MHTPAKRPFDEFILAVVILLVLPLLPLLMEFAVTLIFRPDAQRYLEPYSVMITAPMLAVAVGLASRFKGIAISCAVGAVCLAAIYGAQLSQGKEGVTLAVKEIRQPLTAGQTAPSRAAGHEVEQHRTFWDKLNMDLMPERIAWASMLFVGLVLILERAIRHWFSREPLELEWNR